MTGPARVAEAGSRAAAHDPSGPGSSEPPPRVLLGVTGSVAALAVPNHVFALRALGVRRIGALLTHTGREFFSEAAARAICDEVHTPEERGQHVSIARDHDVFAVLPATAHTLGCLATGQAPNLLCTVALAWQGPILVAPAMNPAMWANRAVARNVAQLRADGHVVVDPVPGLTWECSSARLVDGLGLADPAAMAAAIARVATVRRRRLAA